MNDNYYKLEHLNLSNTDWFVVNWCLGNTCTYSCSYCPDHLHDGSRKWPDVNVIKSFISRVKEQVYPKKLYFEFTGGEVTVYSEFLEVCQFCKDNDVKVGLISNGSRTVRWWEENKHFFDHICISFHPEEADPDHFVKVVNAIHDDVRTHVNIMMSPEKFDYCFDVANKVKDIGNISLALQPLIHDFGDTLFDYSAEQKVVFDKQHELISRHIKYTKTFNYYRGAMNKVYADGRKQASSPHRFISQNTNNWAGWDCYSGVEQIIVDMYGRIYIGWCKVGGAIGNIQDQMLVIPKTPTRCDKTMCHCNFDIMSTKVKVDERSNIIPIIAA